MERSTQYTSSSSRKQPANAGSERKQFTENAFLAPQQIIDACAYKMPSCSAIRFETLYFRDRAPSNLPVTEIAPKSPFLQEGPKGVKWAPGFAYLGPGKMGLTALGLGFNHWERDVQSLNWEWDISPLTIFEYII